MADNPQTALLIVTAQEYAGNIIRQINRQSQLFKSLLIVRGAGKNVAWSAESSGQLAETHADGADAANFGSDAQTAATLNWALLRSPFRVTDLAQDVAGSSMTPEDVVELWSRNVVNSSGTLASLINTQLFSGNGAASPKEITGLDSAIGSISNTYATIDRSSAAYWRPYVIDPGSANQLTLAQIRKDRTAIYTQSGYWPDLALCSPNVFNELGNLFDDNRRYVQQIETARGTVQLNAGFDALMVGGTAFLQDKDATANQIYYLNSNFVELQVLPTANSPSLTEAPNAIVQANDGFGTIPLGFRYKKLATTGSSEKAQVGVTIELAVKRPNACGIRKNVLEN